MLKKANANTYNHDKNCSELLLQGRCGTKTCQEQMPDLLTEQTNGAATRAEERGQTVATPNAGH